MNIKEFAEKYGISYVLVREASFETPTRKRTGRRRMIDYPEDELMEATIANVERKLEFVKLKFADYVGILSKLNNGGENQ